MRISRGSRGQTSRVRGMRFKRVVDARGLTPFAVLCLALLSFAVAPASASTLAGGFKAVPATTRAVEPVQFQRRPIFAKLKKKRLPPRLKPGRLSLDNHKPP